MKRTPLKRKTSLKSKTGFRRAKSTLKRTKLRLVGHSTTKEIKDEIQAIMRQIVILRDGGCLLRNSPVAGACGGRRKDGELILQAEHLNSRTHAVSFADHRLAICLCKRHHIFWKPQEPDLFYRLVKELIGKERTELLEKVQQDFSPHKMDWKLELMYLKQHLKKMEK